MTRSCESIFHEARRRNGAERQAYLREACGDDQALRAEVQTLLEADREAESFLETVAPPDADATADRPAAAGAAPSERAGQMIGRYKLLQPIGEGGFGTVWLAEQKEPVKRRAALKIIKLGMDTKQVIARFEAERQALAMMDHPNIAKVLDAGSTDTGRPYFVMEYVRGIGILEYCDTEKLDTRSRLDLFVKVCHAIQHAHQKGIIHRDIKPTNVMVTLHDGEPVPKVIDFGVAKATNTELTQKTLFTEHRQMIGTPAYMSPEQAEMSGLDIDTRSDIYALGVLLYELLTGTTPFDSKELVSQGFAEMMRIIREEEPVKPSTRLSTLGETATRMASLRSADPSRLGVLLRGDLDWIVMKCLEKDRTRRYDTANGIAADIGRHLRDEPVTAGPPGASYRLRKYVHRNRTVLGAVAAVVLFLVIGLSLAVTGLLEARRERDNAQAAAQREEEARTALEAEQARLRESEGRATLLARLLAGEGLSLAVLPFADASGDPDQAFFASGLTASLTQELGRIEAIRVRPAESVRKVYAPGMSVPEIAAALDVDLLVRGSVVRADEAVHVDVSLVHATETDLWAGTYDETVDDLLNLERRVSTEMMEAVMLQLTGRDRARLERRDTTNPAAREAYYKGVYNMHAATGDDLVRAIAFLDEAIALDPDYALAYATKAQAYLQYVTLSVAPHEFMGKARHAAERALAIDDSLAEAWAALGHVRLSYDYNWEGAEEAFRRALELDPDLAGAHVGLAMYFTTVGEFDMAMRHMRESMRIDPATPLLYEQIGYVPFNARRFDLAIEFCRTAIDLDDQYWAPHAWMGLSMVFSGDMKGGLDALETAHRLQPDSPIALALLAASYAMDGQRARAEAKLEALLRIDDAEYVCPYEIATVFIAMGDHEMALDYLGRAVVARSECMPFLGSDPRMDPLRDDADFDQLMRAIDHPLRGKPAPWLKKRKNPDQT